MPLLAEADTVVDGVSLHDREEILVGCPPLAFIDMSQRKSQQLSTAGGSLYNQGPRIRCNAFCPSNSVVPLSDEIGVICKLVRIITSVNSLKCASIGIIALYAWPRSQTVAPSVFTNGFIGTNHRKLACGLFFKKPLTLATRIFKYPLSMHFKGLRRTL